MYDLRNLFQVNVEEGRHLWAMVYLLHKHFGRDGREEAEALAGAPVRRREQPAHPGRLQREDARLAVLLHMFTYFTDRDGKFQLAALAESAFDPLARTTKFMLTEEAHHMFVGESGVSRVAAAHLPGHERAAQRRRGPPARGRRDRPAHAAALPELPLQRDHRPVRRRPVQQCRHLLQQRPQGPLRGRQARGRPPPARPALQGAGSGGRQAAGKGSTHAQRAQRGAARRLHQGLQRGRGPLEQGHGKGRHRFPPHRAAQGLQPPDRRAGRRAHEPRRPRGQRAGMAHARG